MPAFPGESQSNQSHNSPNHVCIERRIRPRRGIHIARHERIRETIIESGPLPVDFVWRLKSYRQRRCRPFLKNPMVCPNLVQSARRRNRDSLSSRPIDALLHPKSLVGSTPRIDPCIRLKVWQMSAARFRAATESMRTLQRLNRPGTHPDSCQRAVSMDQNQHSDAVE